MFSLSHINKNKGFVILFSVLISAIVLMITVGIFGITTKQTMLAGSAREAHLALGAADSAIECALFGDIQPPPLADGDQFFCGTHLISVQGGSNNTLTFLYSMDTNVSISPCALVSIERAESESIDGAEETIVRARGFNMCSGSSTPEPFFGDPLLVERVYEVTYSRIPVEEPAADGS